VCEGQGVCVCVCVCLFVLVCASMCTYVHMIVHTFEVKLAHVLVAHSHPHTILNPFFSIAGCNAPAEVISRSLSSAAISRLVHCHYEHPSISVCSVTFPTLYNSRCALPARAHALFVILPCNMYWRFGRTHLPCRACSNTFSCNLSCWAQRHHRHFFSTELAGLKAAMSTINLRLHCAHQP